MGCENRYDDVVPSGAREAARNYLQAVEPSPPKTITPPLTLTERLALAALETAAADIEKQRAAVCRGIADARGIPTITRLEYDRQSGEGVWA